MTPVELHAATRVYLIRVAERLVPGEGEDLYQEAFLRAWAHWNDCRDEFNNSRIAWLRSILVNVCLERRRKDKCRIVLLSEDAAASPSIPSPEHDLVTRLTVEACVSRVAAPHRIALHKFLEGEGTPDSASKSSRCRAKKALVAVMAAGAGR